MATTQFPASVRTTAGKGTARKLRASGQIPAIIYGLGRDPQSLALDAHTFNKLLDKISYTTTVIELDVNGKMARTLIRELQRHPVKRNIIHVDFQELVAGEKVTVRVPLKFVGTPVGVRSGGGILDQVMHELQISVDPANIPNHIDVDVNALTIGHSIHVSDLTVPAGITVLDAGDATVCVCSIPKAVEEVKPADGTADAAAPAEPELIRKAKPDDEAEGGAGEEKK